MLLSLARDIVGGWKFYQCSLLVHRQSIMALWGISTYFGKQVPLTQVTKTFMQRSSMSSCWGLGITRSLHFSLSILILLQLF